MEGASRRSPIFYGWWIVAVSLMVMIVHAGAGFYSFARLNTVLADALNTGLGVVTGAVSVYLLVLGVTAPLVGKLTDKYGPRRVILAGGLITGVGLMLLGLTSSVWQLYLLYAVVGIGLSGAGVVPVSAAVSRWFTRRRGLAMGIAIAGIALGAFLLVNFTHRITVNFGWQWAFFGLGLLSFILIIPGTWLVMKTRPQDMGLLPDGAKPVAEVLPNPAAAPPQPVESAAAAAEKSWTVATALKSLRYWLVLVAFFLVGIPIAGVLQNQFNIFTDMGMAPAVAAVALSLTGGIGGIGKVGFGFLADKITPKSAAILCFALQAVGLAVLVAMGLSILTQTQTVAMVWLFVIVFGFAMGGQIALQPLVTGQFFGLASFGAIFGGVALAGALGAALGPVLAGRIFDVTGSYQWPFAIFLAAYILSVVALLLTRRAKPKATS